MANPPSQARTGAAVRSRRRKADRPAEILGAALAVFAERGYAAATMEAVAARAGISKPTIYLYFKTKEDLFAAVALDRVTSVMDRVAKRAGEPGLPARTAIRHALEAIYADLVGTDARIVLRLIAAEGERFPELRHRFEALALERGREAIERIVGAGRESGELRDAPYAALPEVLIAPAAALAVLGSALKPYLSVDPAQ